VEFGSCFMSNSRPTEKNQECDEDAQDRKASNKNTLNHVPVGKHLSNIRRDADENNDPKRARGASVEPQLIR